MLHDVERKIKKINNTAKSDEYKDLVYDLESFIIDMTYSGSSEETPDRQSYLGKVELVGKVLDEKEKQKVFSKIRPVLLKLGMNESVKGFRIIEYCVLAGARLASDSNEYKMKDIYPLVAKDFGITSHNCERLCRYACKGIIPTKEFSQKYPFFEELTHRTYEEITVKELVDILVKYVLIKCNFRNRQGIKTQRR